MARVGAFPRRNTFRRYNNVDQVHRRVLCPRLMYQICEHPSMQKMHLTGLGGCFVDYRLPVLLPKRQLFPNHLSEAGLWEGC